MRKFILAGIIISIALVVGVALYQGKSIAQTPTGVEGYVTSGGSGVGGRTVRAYYATLNPCVRGNYISSDVTDDSGYYIIYLPGYGDYAVEICGANHCFTVNQQNPWAWVNLELEECGYRMK